MEKIYKKYNLNEFLKVSTLLLVFSDIIIICYCYTIGTDKSYILKHINQIKNRAIESGQITNEQLPSDFESQLFMLWEKSFIMIIIFIIVYHGLVYFLWNKKKKYARNYILFYSYTGSIGCLLGSFFLLSSSLKWFILIFLAGLSLGFVGLGARQFTFPVIDSGSKLKD